MITKLKQFLYFPLASYFRFFAWIRLKRWNPVIIVVTGSNGKTTLLHLLESQIGTHAKYSHHANSSFGIPFDILDLHRETLQKTEWPSLLLRAPQQVFKPLPKEKIYVVEADCDRPGEGKFLAEFLRPHIVLWVSSARTHSMNFDYLVDLKMFSTVDEAIAFEYGYFAEYCRKLLIIDGESKLEQKQLERTKAEVKKITKSDYLKNYKVSKEGTTFELKYNTYSFTYLLPEETYLALAMCKETVDFLDLPSDKNFDTFILPPGRGSIFDGVKDLTIIDSSYNANLSSMKVTLEMFTAFPADKKWAVIGDMLELGKEEEIEHEKLAELLVSLEVDRIILMGPRVKKYTFPKLQSIISEKTQLAVFENPKEVLDFIEQNIARGETILFKGARFMEGIIEHLLRNKEDIEKLPRREKVWEERRKQWGL